ncbi:MAG: hypothetical protein BCS36_09885 [Desulfovibrio sp. MES5]|nr:MAG: hypothetical protein BCS36_09885 [Desulfovibrio sp. MES5]
MGRSPLQRAAAAVARPDPDDKLPRLRCKNAFTTKKAATRRESLHFHRTDCRTNTVITVFWPEGGGLRKTGGKPTTRRIFVLYRKERQKPLMVLGQITF